MTTVKAIQVLICLGLATWSARAGDLKAEWDFQNPSGRLAQAAPTASKAVSNLLSSATFNPGPNRELALPFFDPALQKGSMTVKHGSYQGIFTVPERGQPKSTAGYRAYLDNQGAFGPLTVAVAFKPNFKGVSKKPRVLFSVCTWMSSHCIELGVAEGRLLMHTGYPGTNGSACAAAIADYKWDQDTWYFVAGSVEDFKKATVYVRPLTGSNHQTAQFGVSTNVVNDSRTGPTDPPEGTFTKPGADGVRDASGPHDQPLRLGGTPNFYGGGTDDFGADGTFARVQVWKRYLPDQKGFDELYKLWRKM